MIDYLLLQNKATPSTSSQVGSLKDMYHFVLDKGEEVHMPEKTTALRAEPAVSSIYSYIGWVGGCYYCHVTIT